MNDITLINGDCLRKMKNIPDKSIDMILCDLPFNTTRNKWDSPINLKKLWSQYTRIVKDNAVIALFAQVPFNILLGASNLKLLKYEWIWMKPQGTSFLNAKIAPLKAHENILIFYKKKPKYYPQMCKGEPYITRQSSGSDSWEYNRNYGGHITVSNGDRYPIDVLRYSRDKKTVHPTQKPVALCEYLIKTYTDEGDIVLDNCMGSGTTGVACKSIGRKFIGIEKERKYFDIAEKRISGESVKASDQADDAPMQISIDDLE